MTGTVPPPDRRTNRSPHIDRALEKFLDAVRRDNDILAIVVTEEHGLLVATSSDDFSEASLSALATFSASVQSRILPSSKAESSSLKSQLDQMGADHVVIHVFPAGEIELTLTIVGKRVIADTQLERAKGGICRILAVQKILG